MKLLKSILSLIILLNLLILTGCWDRRELEQRIPVVAIGLDAAEEDMIKLSIQIPVPIAIAGSAGGGGGPSVRVMSSTGRTVAEAYSNLQKRLNQELFFGHTRVIAIGEKLARKGIAHTLDAFRRDPLIRRLLWPIIVKGEAYDLLESDPQLEQIPMIYIMELIENGAKTGRIPDISLGKLFVSLSTYGKQPIINVVEAKSKDTPWKGIGVFRDDKMVGILDPEETWLIMQMVFKKVGGDITFPIEIDGKKNMITFRPNNVESDYRVTHTGGVQIKTSIEVYVQGDIIEAIHPFNFNQIDLIPKLEEVIKKEMERRANAVVKKLKNDYKSDILRIGMFVKAFHYKDLWKKYDWNTLFPKSDIHVTYRIKIRRFGMEMK